MIADYVNRKRHPLLSYARLFTIRFFYSIGELNAQTIPKMLAHLLHNIKNRFHNMPSFPRVSQ